MSNAGYLEILFPVGVAKGAKGGSVWKTNVLTFASGKEQRIAQISRPYKKWDVGQLVKTAEEMTDIDEFFDVAWGKLNAFRFKDWKDFIVYMEPIATGDGVTRVFQASKTYGRRWGVKSWTRGITKLDPQAPVMVFVNPTPATPTAIVQLAPTAYASDPNTGLITLTTAPALGAIVYLTCQFHHIARFDTDQNLAALTEYSARDWDQIPIVEDPNLSLTIATSAVP
jgi:uncharacterized protein (TIGR02217 family)